MSAKWLLKRAPEGLRHQALRGSSFSPWPPAVLLRRKIYETNRRINEPNDKIKHNKLDDRTGRIGCSYLPIIGYEKDRNYS